MLFLTEMELRSIIRKQLLKEGVAWKKDGVSSSKNSKSSSSTNSDSASGSYSGPLVVSKGTKKYLGDPSIGLSPPGFWDKFRKDLESSINKSYPELGLTIDNLGVTRDLAAAADNGGNAARVSGSKHGAGLAQDCYFHTKKYGKFTSYKNDNPKLANDQKLVDAIISFLISNSEYKEKIIWGGSFESGKTSLSKGEKPKGRGITEFHHFEFKNELIPGFLSNHEAELKKLGLKSSNIKSTKSLGELYKKLL